MAEDKTNGVAAHHQADPSSSSRHSLQPRVALPKIDWNIASAGGSASWVEWVHRSVCTVTILVRNIDPEACVAVVGSVATKLCLEDSDLDLVVTTGVGSWRKHSWESELVFLSDLQHQLINNAGISTSCSVLVEAKVPLLIIKCDNGRSIDVSMNQLHSIGHVFFFHSVMDTYPELRPLLIFVKRWIKARNLTTAKNGGMPVVAWLFLAVYACFETFNIRSFFELIGSGCRSDIRLPANFPKSPPVVKHNTYFALYDPCARHGVSQNLIEGVSPQTLQAYQVEAKRALKDMDLGRTLDDLLVSFASTSAKDTDAAYSFGLYLVDLQAMIGTVKKNHHANSPPFARKDNFFAIEVFVLIGRVLVPCRYTRDVHPSHFVSALNVDGFVVSDESMWLLKEMNFCEDYEKYFVEMQSGS
eukprot:GEMP01006030.1.p1 GENE.GEMP01006030.1~~GEMP01006030.1.p1  ORF type:complete len:415 (+),score=81.71 GEMP01006030.1:160-1404(+)